MSALAPISAKLQMQRSDETEQNFIATELEPRTAGDIEMSFSNEPVPPYATPAIRFPRLVFHLHCGRFVQPAFM
jgi:hypothetical protein